MLKAVITEKLLLDAINIALANDWPHKDRPCRVEALIKTTKPDRNWDVDIYSTSGPDLLHSTKCDEIRQHVLNELMPKYDVIWDK